MHGETLKESSTLYLRNLTHNSTHTHMSEDVIRIKKKGTDKVDFEKVILHFAVKWQHYAFKSSLHSEI